MSGSDPNHPYNAIAAPTVGQNVVLANGLQGTVVPPGTPGAVLVPAGGNTGYGGDIYVLPASQQGGQGAWATP